MMSKPNGVILWQGPSLLDGAPVVAIAVGLNAKSKNSKTGAMLQTYILRSDVDPIAAVRTDADVSICGNCPARGLKGKKRTCYVNLGQGPRAVYAAFKAGKYPRAVAYAGAFYASRDNGALAVGHSMVIRLGTYGDPAAVPVDVWRALLRHGAGHTGYTHQWRTAPELRDLCMASVDSPQEAREAQAWGWRTFRVGGPRNTVSPSMLREVLCPASEQAGKKLTCSQCLACAGADGRKGSIYIPVHGGFATMANVRARAAIAG